MSAKNFFSKVLHWAGFNFGAGFWRSKTLHFTGLVQADAQESTARFFLENMRTAFIAQNREQIWQSGLDRTAGGGLESGLILEFGVWKGESLTWLAEKSNRSVFGFDGFDGLQEDWAGALPKGSFAIDFLPKVQPNVTLVVGRAQETLPKFLEAHREPVRFAHFDMDTYQSTLDVLRLLRPRLVPGSVIVFDELIGYPVWQEGEYRAWSEFVAEARVSFKYFATTGCQAGVEIL